MEDIILKLHIAVMCFVHNRVDGYMERREDGFTTAELLANAALGILALGAIWTYFNGTLFGSVKSAVSSQIH